MEAFVYAVWKHITAPGMSDTALGKSIRQSMTPDIQAMCELLHKRDTARLARQEADAAVRRAEAAETEATAAEGRHAAQREALAAQTGTR